jgi:acetylornithine deacetylase
MDVCEFAMRLIDIPSVTGDEAACAAAVEARCSEMGLEVERLPVAANRWNLAVNWRAAPRVVFCTHLDTVPPFFPSRLEDGLLHGRGACDAKGILAAMLAAGEALLREGAQPAFLFVAGEETDSIGAKSAAASGRRADYIVVGEPTGNVPAEAHKGMLSYTLAAEGRAAHSAYPERGASALHALLDVLADIRAAAWGTDPVLGPSTLNVGLMRGGVAPNVTAPSAEAVVYHRIVDAIEPRREQLERIVAGRASIRVHSAVGAQRMLVPEGYPRCAVSFGSDIPYLRAMAAPLLAGPGSIHQAHADDEHVAVDELLDAVGLYIDLYHALTR